MYTSAQGPQSRRQVEPLKLVPRGRRWYLVCWDLDRDDWRTFRVDRIGQTWPTGQRFVPRSLPASDAGEYVRQHLGSSQPDYTARVIIHAPISVTRPYLGSAGWGAAIFFLGVSRVLAAVASEHTSRRWPELLLGLAVPAVIILYMLKFSQSYPARIAHQPAASTPASR